MSYVSICYKSVPINLYREILQQVEVVGFLGVLFEESLKWSQFTDKVKDK